MPRIPLLRTATAIILLLCLSPAARAQTSPAEAALLQGRADDAIRLLQPQLAADPDNAPAHLLLCRVYLSEDLPDAAVPECDAAAARAAGDSTTQLWLGRAYGAKASAANPIHAFELARKVRADFERAVQLNGNSGPALSDLGEFYVEAPAIVGGGLDKARALASAYAPARRPPPAATL